MLTGFESFSRIVFRCAGPLSALPCPYTRSGSCSTEGLKTSASPQKLRRSIGPRQLPAGPHYDRRQGTASCRRTEIDLQCGMKETFTHTAKYRPVYQVIAVALMVLGVFIGIVTFLTVIGPFLGLLLVAIGGFILWSLRRPTETMEEPPHAE